MLPHHSDYVTGGEDARWMTSLNMQEWVEMDDCVTLDATGHILVGSIESPFEDDVCFTTI